MSHLSQNKNNSMGNDEYDDIRVVEDVTIVKIRENSSMMDKDGIEDGEMVDEDGGDVSDKNAHEEIDKLSMEKNKGVFGCADKEFADCNVVFGSMNRNDVVKEKELDQQRKADEKCNVSAMYDSAIKTDDVRIVNKLKNESFEKSYARTVEKIELNKNLFSIPTSKKENRDEVVVFDEEIVKEGSKKWVNTVCGYFIGCNMGHVELRNVEGMNTIAEPDRIPVWIKLFNIPLEAWSVKGISALASRLGKPLVMDDMTASMCHNGNGRSAFARVLVEIEVVKGFKDLIERQYKDKNNNVIRTKFVKVKFSWNPISCSHCNVFRHSDSRCYKNGTKKDQIENDKGTKVNHHNEGFVEVRHRRYGFMGLLRRSANKYSILADDESNEEISKEFMERRLEVDRFVKEKILSSNGETADWTYDMKEYYKYKWKEVNRMSNQSDSETEDDLVFEENEAIKNLVADELDGVDTGGMCIEDKQKEVKEIIIKENLYVCDVIKTHLKENKVSKIGNVVFGNWQWCSNAHFSTNSCRILIRWNPNQVSLMNVHTSKQAIMCIVESVKRNAKFFCSFIYASNSGRERQDLWAILQDQKSIANNRPWILMGDDVSLCDVYFIDSSFKFIFCRLNQKQHFNGQFTRSVVVSCPNPNSLRENGGFQPERLARFGW
ncbi:RNA-directed DNA polymerase, eukaryota, reverse transcriptase zinc-binding domain protein [Tanacetum coccineum]